MLRLSGRTRQPQTSPQSRSRPRTRGGSSQRTAGRAQQQHSGSDREAAGQDSDAESEPPQVELLDLKGIPGPRVKRLRYVTLETWFSEQRDVGVDRHFHTLLQESFYHAYCQMDIKISEHKMLPWVALRVAAGGIPVLPFFERYDGLPACLVRGLDIFKSGSESSTPLCSLRRTVSLLISCSRRGTGG